MGEKSHIYLVTGCAGFIGFHLSLRLLSEGYTVVGVDNLNNYYEVSLKQARLGILKEHSHFTFICCSLEDWPAIQKVFLLYPFSAVINLAAQAGVRYSFENPRVYIDTNITGFFNILEACRKSGTGHLIYASSSSVYGSNTRMPFSVHQNVDHPVSIYAATKKANELMAHTYSHIYGLPTTGLRFFTVYGPWGRPDMAYFSFTQSILAGKTLKVFNYGNMKRDFTYIDDITEGIVRLLDKPAKPNPAWDGEYPDPGSSRVPYRLYNIGNNNPVGLLELISVLEQKLDRKARLEFLPLQPGDIPETYADIGELIQVVGFKPQTPLEQGIEKFVNWYRRYYSVGL